MTLSCLGQSEAKTAVTKLQVLIGLAALICDASALCSDDTSSVSSRFAAEGDTQLLIDTAREIDAAAKADAAYSSSNAGALKNEDFVDLYRHPYWHFPITLKIIESGSADDETLIWLIRMSQCLKTPDYLVLGEALYREFGGGSLKEDVLATYVSPGTDWGVPFATRYQDEKVRAFLLQLLQSEKVGEELRDTINAILAGEQSRFVAAHRAAGESIPVLACSP